MGRPAALRSVLTGCRSTRRARSTSFRPWAPAVRGPPASPSSPPPSPAEGLSAALAWNGRDEVPDGLRFDFSPRTWDDLDGWEKTGLVVSGASAAAGLGYLLYQLFD